MTAESSANAPKLEKAGSPLVNSTANSTSARPNPPELRRHTHWVTHFLIWILATAIAALAWKVVQLEQRTHALEERMAQQSSLSSGKNTPSSLLPSTDPVVTSATPPQPTTTSSATPPAAAPVPELVSPAISASLSAATDSNKLATAASGAPSPLTPAPVTPSVAATPPLPAPLPEWVRRTPLSVAHAFLREGNWEAATHLLDTLRPVSLESVPQPEVETLWRAVHAQRPALDTMKQQLQQLEARVAALSVRSIQPVSAPPLIKNTPVWAQIWNEVQHDVTQLISIEPRNAATLRARSEAAFEYREHVIQALRDYHRAWRQGNRAEQERLRPYIHALLDYAFDMNTAHALSFREAINAWMQHPPLLRPVFPGSAFPGASGEPS